MDEKFKVAVASYLYPTDNYLSQGIFVKDEAEQTATKIPVILLIPTRISLPFTKKWNQTHGFLHSSIQLFSSGYLSFPKRKLPLLTKLSLEETFSRLLKDKSLDIIHLHFLYPTGLVIPWLKKRSYKVVLTVHGSDFYETSLNKSLWKFLTDSVQSADKILCVGDKLKNDMISFFPSVPDHKFQSISHGIDTSFFKPVQSNMQIHSPLRLLSVANMYNQKGVDILVEALHFLDIKTSFNFSLTLVSAGGDPSYRASVLDLINKYDLEKKIHILSSQKRDELLELYRSHDIYIQPSRRETFGLATAEAASTGLPVVANSVGGLSNIVTSEVGILSNKTEPFDLYNALINLINNYDSYSPDKIHNSITERFSVHTKINTIIDVYKNVLE